MNRKPPVVAIKGSHRKDVISQLELGELSDSQAAEWAAQRITQKKALRIEDRIRHGAGIEPGALTFDAEMKMARTRKAEQKA